MNYPELENLIQVVKKLRDPVGGCPWDLKQTHQSLLKYLVEECYEYIHAAESGSFQKMEEELGDVLLQILLHSTIAEEKGSFTIESVSKTLAEKLITRHPHVFQQRSAQNLTPEQVERNWQQIKEEEKAQRGQSTYEIDEGYLKFPGPVSALKIGKKTKELGFDWEDHKQVAYKVEEEWQELKEELAQNIELNKKPIAEELGDLMFTIVQLARHLNIDPEECLRQANSKFVTRFMAMEDLIRLEHKSIKDLVIDEMENYWQQAKVKCKSALPKGQEHK